MTRLRDEDSLEERPGNEAVVAQDDGQSCAQDTRHENDKDRTNPQTEALVIILGCTRPREVSFLPRLDIGGHICFVVLSTPHEVHERVGSRLLGAKLDVGDRHVGLMCRGIGG